MQVSSLLSVDTFEVSGEPDSSKARQVRSKRMSPMTAYYDCAVI